jgi:multiple antibiotic resistance protein
MMLEKLFRDFMIFWTTVDPPGTLALFAGLTAALSAKERRRVALRASIYSAIILLVAVVIGQVVLDAMGVRVLSLKLSGGIILFLFALQMLFGAGDQGAGASAEKNRDIAVFPLAVPSIAGPGAIMAVILRTDNDVYTVPQQAESAVVLVIVLLLNYIILLLSGPILRLIGQTGASILVRVMGILLAALAVEIVMNALSIGSWAVPLH